MIILVLDILRDSLSQFIFNIYSRILFLSGWITQFLLCVCEYHHSVPHPVPPQTHTHTHTHTVPRNNMQVIQQRECRILRLGKAMAFSLKGEN